MSEKSYKLTYFKARGRGEFIRLVFLIAGVEFEDHQIDVHEEWPSVKASKYWSRVLMTCSVGFSLTCIFEYRGFDLQRSSKAEKLSFAIHTCCAYQQLRPCARRGGGWKWGRIVRIDKRRGVTIQQRTARIGDCMVKSPKMRERAKKLKAIEFKTTYERDKENFEHRIWSWGVRGGWGRWF